MIGHSRNRSGRIFAAALAAAFFTACHGVRVQPAVPTPAMAAMATTDPTPASTPAAIARAKADSLRYPYTPADVAFMTNMIGHHAQAIVMATMAPTHGANAEIRTLAARIIISQQDEIAIMQRWLGDRRQLVPSATGGAMPMMMHGQMHEMLMPGMLTAAQMQTLDASRKNAFDENFLTFMMQHHRGALSMVKDLFATDGAGQDETVFKFASDVNVDQTTEIARMERMLFMLKLGKK